MHQNVKFDSNVDLIGTGDRSGQTESDTVCYRPRPNSQFIRMPTKVLDACVHNCLLS